VFASADDPLTASVALEYGVNAHRLGAMAKSKRQFEIEIEAKVLVDAFDEASARKKVEKALAEKRRLGEDVSATGTVWTYAATQVGGVGGPE
jgi:hypothetical protein